MKRKLMSIALVIIIISLLAACGSDSSSAEGKPDKIRLDYAYYSPTSLVLKEQGWLEEALEDEGIGVEWVLSQGSNKALEFLTSNSIDFGSSAGSAALVSKSKGSPIQNVYIYSQPEWTALVANSGSGIQSVEELKGKKVAATLGTDPYIFLLRALNEAGLSANDLEIVNLQHRDGAVALSKGSVDAWAGLDPHMARAELESDANLFYRNKEFNTYGFLNVREDFAQKYPDYVDVVIEAYEKAREWTIDNPEEAAKILSEEAEMSLDVAKQTLERNDFSNPIPGDEHRDTLRNSAEVLLEGEIIEADMDVEKVVNELVQPSFIEELNND